MTMKILQLQTWEILKVSTSRKHTDGFGPVFDNLEKSALCILTFNNIKNKMYSVFIDTELQFLFLQSVGKEKTILR